MLSLFVITFILFVVDFISWPDVLPLTLHDITYLPMFALEHYLFVIMGFIPHVDIILFEDYSFRLIISGCIDLYCAQ